jgi:hypothetical protein
MFVEIERIAEDKLNSRYWRFHLDTKYTGLEISLWQHSIRSRRTTRCKWVNDKIYQSIDTRHNSIKAEDIILPEDVKAEFKEMLIEQINDSNIEIR